MRRRAAMKADPTALNRLANCALVNQSGKT
jgi:hypothetical protein